MYSEKVMDHFQHPRNVGEIENASGVGTVGNAKCGDIMRIYLDIDENQIIRDCKFKTFGCGAAVATSSMATELVKGKNINEAFLFKNIEIALDFLYTNKKLQFENGFYFDMNRELLFQGKKTIKLTKTEKKLINLLALNPNVLVTYEHISSVVWKGKEFSIYSLRNVIKHIREKTDETFIKNSSNKGYVINTI